MKVCVVGLGYIGLPTALMLASRGVDVVGVDYSSRIVNELRSGSLTFEEDGLAGVFSDARQNGIEFSDSYVAADVYIVAVPTPYDKNSKRVDASYVVSAVKSVVSVCGEGAIIVVESTIAPGTIDRYIRPIVDGKNVQLAHAPERIIPGNMIYELEHNSRTIGADSENVGMQLKTLYSSFCKGAIALTDIRTAEMSKVVENTYRDINIAFANELAQICEAADMDVHEVIRIANCHPRVNILNPGPGVGGHCISVDPWFLVGDYPSLANLIWQARKVNDSMPEYVLGRVAKLMTKYGIWDASRVGFYGLTYKENVDDVRESPTLQLEEQLDAHLGSGRVKYYDPFVDAELIDGQMFDLGAFLNAVDLVVIMVGHDEIKANVSLLAEKVVFDTRNCLNLQKVERL